MVANILITGLGGQGVVTLAKLVSRCASDLGLMVSLFNSKGMAQRGGRVTSEIRISDNRKGTFGSRLASGGADILLGMEIGESANSAHFLKAGGTAILLNYASVPTTIVLKKQEYPDLHQVLNALKKITPRCYGVEPAASPQNIFLLGVFSAITGKEDGILAEFAPHDLKESIKSNLKRNIEENLAVFDKGHEYGGNLVAF
jgi:indolepyruvate ferredoxin oxidoreductase beta subunit